MDAEEFLRAGEPEKALKALQEVVRSKPSDARHRVFLFQLLCVLGQWERALTQLDVCAELDPSALAMREVYRGAIGCELLRRDVFQGKRSPLLFGEPDEWIALLIESLLRAGRGEREAASGLRDEAFEKAPTTSGALNDQPFQWIADADMRLGPVLEAMVNGRYYWIPFSRLARIAIEEPTDLRDYVWAPAHLEFANGGETLALIPSRYVGSETSQDGLVILGRKTLWDETAEGGAFVGQGQRVLTTDQADFPLLEVRSITLDVQAE